MEVYFRNEQPPAVERKDEGLETVLTMSYEGYFSDDDQAGEIELKYKYTLNVDFIGTSIVITQNFWARYYAKALSTSNHDVIIDDLRTDTYPITVVDGELVVGASTAALESRAHPEDRNSFVGTLSGINRITESVKDQLNQLQSIKLETIPTSAMQGFVFPGGKTFTFTHAEFSKHQDLIAFIKYIS